VSKRIIILVAVAAVGLVLVVTVPPLLSSPSQIADKAAGTWQEVGQTPAYTMHVSHTSGTSYAVTYPRWQYDGEGFQLQGYDLRGGGGENSMNDAVKTISYDNGSDELTIRDKSGEHSYTFTRVTRPSGIVGVMREAGGPFPGLRRLQNVLIEVRWSTSTGPIVATTTSSPKGKFKVTVAPGDYAVVPIAKGDETVIADSVAVQPGSYALAKPFFSVR
jgi:hypothetical protein